MKKILKFNFLLIAIVSFTFQSCFIDDDEGDVELRHAWIKSDSFSEGLFNSAVINNQLMVAGATSIYMNASVNNQSNSTDLRQYMTRPGYFKLPLSNNVLVTRRENDLRLFSASSPTEANSYYVRGVDLDPDYMQFEDLPYWTGEAFGLNNRGYVLLSYRAMDERNIAENNPSFFLIKTRMDGSKVMIDSHQIIKPTRFTYFATMVQMESFEDFFIVRSGSATNVIYLDGTYEQLNRIPTKTIELNGKIIAIGIDKPAGELIFNEYSGANQWTAANKYNVNNTTVMDGKFTTVDGQIVSFLGDRIFHLRMNGNNINVEELDNSRIVGGTITSITQIDENTIFSTVVCEGNNAEACGGFYKSKEDFFKPILR